MKEKRDKIDRRNFLKAMGTASLAPAFMPLATGFAAAKNKTTEKTQKPRFPQMPRRKLGKTGIDVPCLSLGTLRVDTENQILLRKTLQAGIDYWDTAYSYSNGNVELGIGKFLAKNPDVRKKLFLVTKASGAKKQPTPKAVVAAVEERLQTSLKRLNTNYIDLYYGIHVLDDPAQLTDELKQWAKEAKKRGLIRFFGFTTHSNMAPSLAAAAKLDWIDVIMTSYNFRLMQDKELNAAIEACHKAGIGLIAMKVQGRRQKIETEEDKKLASYFLQRGFTEGQAKIKAVLQDKRFSSACVGMPNVHILNENVAAALDKTKLTQADIEVFKQYTEATCSSYCAGCAHICQSALPNVPYVSDIMRYLMYYNSYGEKEMARELFAEIPRTVRNKLLRTNYRLAEARCPQHLPIGELVAEAVSKLA
ncbi:MAG: aldo/keto reductase [Sedimentisphaerales bacterium]